MQLCDDCVTRHNSNAVLAAHQLIAVSDTRAVLAMFCTKHREQPIRYFCSECHVTLCSICAIGHDPSHKPEALEQGVLERYRSVFLSLCDFAIIMIMMPGQFLMRPNTAEALLLQGHTPGSSGGCRECPVTTNTQTKPTEGL